VRATAARARAGVGNVTSSGPLRFQTPTALQQMRGAVFVPDD